MKPIFLLILLLISLTNYAQPEKGSKYGLSFKGHLENLDGRTSLNLTPENPIRTLEEGFNISFDLKLRKEIQTFGYVFRMIVDEKSSFDFISNLTEHELNFVINDRVSQEVKSTRLRDPQVVTSNKWIPVSITYYYNKTEIVINGKNIVLKKGFNRFKNIELIFGANSTKYFHTTEVPPITIKDIKIRNNGYLAKHWILGKHKNTSVYDEVNNALAVVKYPLWEINKHTEWENNAILNFKTPPQIAFDKNNGRVFFVSQNSVLVYSVSSNKIDTIKVVSGNPYNGVSRQIVYHPKKDQLLSYTVQSPNVYSFSFKTKSWSGAPDAYIDSRQHHNMYLDTNTNTLNMMMGYGYHQYSNELSKLSLDKENAKWVTQSFKSQIMPRYLSALGSLDKNHILMLGGFGSKSGRQEEFPHNIYDLHKINIQTGESTKLWELKIDTPYIVFSNSMYIDTAKNKLFVLGYNNFIYKSAISLYCFDVNSKQPTFKQLSHTLPFNFLDIESYCDLFYDDKKAKLFALTSNKIGDNNYEVKVYSIAYPVFEETEIYQQEPKYYMSYVAGAAILLVLGLIFSLIKKISKPVAKVKTKKEAVAEVVIKIEERKLAKEILTINLLSDFQFVTKDGVDHTGEFTPILKQIFIFLLLHNLEKDKIGVSSYVLDQAFWVGMSQEKAVNNRSVNIRKLRILLSSFSDIEIVNKNTYWLLKFNEEFICDYQTVNILLAKLDNNEEAIEANVLQLIKLLKGKLLPSIESEWIDDFKSKFTSLLIKTLLETLKNPKLYTNSSLRLQITDIILLYDSLDENAIIYKTNLLYKSGQKGQSKAVFEKYCAEYEQTFLSVSNLNYNNIILLAI